jgi:hypothetical protein
MAERPARAARPPNTPGSRPGFFIGDDDACARLAHVGAPSAARPGPRSSCQVQRGPRVQAGRVASVPIENPPARQRMRSSATAVAARWRMLLQRCNGRRRQVADAPAALQRSSPPAGGCSCSAATAVAASRRMLLQRCNSRRRQPADAPARAATAVAASRRMLLQRCNSRRRQPANAPAALQQRRRKPAGSICTAAAASPRISGRICSCELPRGKARERLCTTGGCARRWRAAASQRAQGVRSGRGSIGAGAGAGSMCSGGGVTIGAPVRERSPARRSSRSAGFIPVSA